MAIKSFLFTLSLLLISCSSVRTHQGVKAETSSDLEQVEEKAKVDEESERVVEQKEVPKKVAIIFGPGGVRSFAHVGVLKEFTRARIPIQLVSGIEWGSLIAAIYSQKALIHELEWKLYKLDAKNFPSPSLFSQKISAEPVVKLDDFLKASLGDMTHQQASIPMFCPTVLLSSGAFYLQESGKLRESVRKCLPWPPLYSGANNWLAAGLSAPNLIQQMKRRGADLIIFINVTSAGEIIDINKTDQATVLLWQELRRQLLAPMDSQVYMVQVDTGPIRLYDFSKRQEMVRIGETVGQRAAKDLIEKYGF